MKRSEVAKVLLEEIVRTRTQPTRLRKVVEERKSGMDQCEECDRLWKEYQRATIESVQLDAEVRSMTEGQGLQKFREAAARAEAAEQLRVQARQRLAEHLAATEHR